MIGERDVAAVVPDPGLDGYGWPGQTWKKGKQKGSYFSHALVAKRKQRQEEGEQGKRARGRRESAPKTSTKRSKSRLFTRTGVGSSYALFFIILVFLFLTLLRSQMDIYMLKHHFPLVNPYPFSIFVGYWQSKRVVGRISKSSKELTDT